MNHSRIVLVGGAVIGIFILLVAIGFSPRAPFGGKENLLTSGTSGSNVSSVSSVPTAPSFVNGFVPGAGSVSLSNSGSDTATWNGKPVTSLNDVADIVAAAPSPAPVSANTVTPLPIPQVTDAEITIDPTGVATPRAFLAYFNEHSTRDISFDNSKLNDVLKDKNGVPLLVPALIERAAATNNFSEIHDSLAVQKEFAAAEIAFLRGIKVTAEAATLDKRTIGVEELLIQLVNKTLAVEAGTTTKDSLLAYESQFLAATDAARAEVLSESGALAVAPAPKPLTLLERLKNIFLTALSGTASHDLALFVPPSGGGGPPVPIGGGGGGGVPTVNPTEIPFGGQISVPIPCPCDAGFWIIVGPPKPASLFVPFAFLATPLFFEWKSLTPGAWWLGLYNPILQLPCLSLLFCSPIGTGGEIIMTGTSVVGI